MIIYHPYMWVLHRIKSLYVSINGISHTILTIILLWTPSRLNWNLEKLVFEERGTQRKLSQGKDKNQQQTPTYG